MTGRNRTGVIVAAVLLAATGAVAQPLGVPPGRWWERPQVADQLALTAEQKARLETLSVETARGMIDLKATAEKAELDLRAAAEAEPFDATKVWSDRAEMLTLDNTKEVFPGLYVAGMAANATFGGPRMGPIFGGMLLSGEKVAKMLLQELTPKSKK